MNDKQVDPGPDSDKHHTRQSQQEKTDTAAPASHGPAVMLAVLGVVFGDIGTSPIYALRQCFFGSHAFSLTPPNIYGVVSLIFWSLIIMISVKYMVFVLRADNNGVGADGRHRRAGADFPLVQ